MEKGCDTNIYYNAYINKNNKLVIGDGDVFDCDNIQILKNTFINENGFLVLGKVKYDLEDKDIKRINVSNKE